MSTASVAGLMAVPGLAPYNAAKFGVVAIMETLHHEMARDGDAKLGVSVLCPGVVRTNIATAQRNRPDHLRRQRNEVGNVSAKLPKKPVPETPLSPQRSKTVWTLKKLLAK